MDSTTYDLLQLTCKQCGKTFTAKRAVNYVRGKTYKKLYCSANCQRASLKREPKRYLCKHCGQEFTSKRTDRTTYCSRECAFADRVAKPKPPKVDTYAECPVCGKTFLQKSIRSKYCSRECQYRGQQNIDSDAPLLTRACSRCGKAGNFFAWKDAYGPYLCVKCRRDLVAQSRVTVTVKCRCCGKVFNVSGSREPLLRARKHCSKSCAKEYENIQRRIREQEAFVESVSRQYIYKRDGGRCQICGKKVDFKKSCPHPKAATLDHIVPLAKGGKHERKNVQLAHFICNSNKRDIAEGQLLLIG